MRALIRLLVAAASSVLLGLVLIAIAAYGWFLRSGPQPRVWHTAQLDEEFTRARAAEVTTIADYRRLEDRLFDELKVEVLDEVEPRDRNAFNRFSAGSRSDPAIWPTNWNRTFEMTPERVRGAALLLHGLTDSPYSMRSIGEALAADGFKVVGLRLPGHGTAPSGLVTFEVEDMQAAVRMAMRDLRRQVGEGVPIYLVGYSNGAALSVDYAVSVLEGEPLPRPAGLVLLSPAIGISPFAVVARLKTGLSAVPGFERAAWQEIVTEFDPYKYSSFSFNAAGQTQRLTSSVAKRMLRLADGGQGKVQDFPPTLAFLSTVDSTVKAEAVVDALLEHLAPGGHELVLFDLNRLALVQPLLIEDPGPLTQKLLAMPNRSFTLTVITNASREDLHVHELRAEPGTSRQTTRAIDLAWPTHVFSLSHVALPFPVDDPLYGYETRPGVNHVQLGRIQIHGENGVLSVPSWMLTRQRSNPFHPYMIQRIEWFMGGAAAPPP